MQTRLTASVRANALAQRDRITNARERVQRLTDRATRAIGIITLARAVDVDRLGQLLDALSYRAVLERGFTLVRDTGGHPMHSARREGRLGADHRVRRRMMAPPHRACRRRGHG